VFRFNELSPSSLSALLFLKFILPSRKMTLFPEVRKSHCSEVRKSPEVRKVITYGGSISCKVRQSAPFIIVFRSKCTV
jgi:hypothetical protein